MQPFPWNASFVKRESSDHTTGRGAASTGASSLWPAGRLPRGDLASGPALTRRPGAAGRGHLVDGAGCLEGLGVGLHEGVEAVHVGPQHQLHPIRCRQRLQPPLPPPPLPVLHPPPVLRRLRGMELSALNTAWRRWGST